jgi:alpha-galactosidase
MDGQHLNAVPPDYNLSHKLEYPEQSVEQLPAFFKMVYDTATAIKPQAVMEICPCGTNCSFYNMAYMNQSVSSDPLNSWQIRLKGKTFKALMGRTAYYGDHVELSDGGMDFSSSFGVGAVLGTKFTWPKDNPKAAASYLLTPDKEVIWKKWFGLYNEMMLSKEPYLGELYDIGYDKPEAHTIRKGETLYYAFYAPKWSGTVELRGLQEKGYRVRDYVNGKDYAMVQGPVAPLPVQFNGYLLLEAAPE